MIWGVACCFLHHDYVPSKNRCGNDLWIVIVTSLVLVSISAKYLMTQMWKKTKGQYFQCTGQITINHPHYENYQRQTPCRKMQHHSRSSMDTQLYQPQVISKAAVMICIGFLCVDQGSQALSRMGARWNVGRK